MSEKRIFIAVVSCCLLVSVVSPAWGASCAGVTDPEQKADCLGEMLNSAYSADGGIQDRAEKPLTSDEPFVDLDGNPTFTANLSCHSSDVYLDVLVSLSATYDATVTINQDTDLDGMMDFTVNISGVSGVCSNGFIVCSPGSWTGCTAYKWSVSALDQVEYSQVAVGDLGGCYCINASCTSTGVSPEKVAQDMGSGAVGALQQAHPDYAVSGAEVSAGKAEFYGQDTECSGAASDGQVETYKDYYSTASADDPYASGNLDARMESDTNTTIADDTSGAGKHYSNVNTYRTNTGYTSTEETCSITKDASLSTSVTDTQVTGSASASVDYFLLGRMTTSGGSYLIQYTQTGTSVTNPTWVTLHTFTPTEPNVNFNITMEAPAANGCTTEGPVNIGSLDTAYQLATCSTAGNQDVTVNFSGAYYESSSTVTVTTTDTCGTIDPSCSLYKEAKDGYLTYDNYQPVSSSHPPTICKDISGFIHCEPFWNVQRTYICEGGDSFDFTDALARSESISDTTTDSGTQISYTDRTVDEDGNVVTTTEAHKRNPTSLEVMTEECEPSCRVTKAGEGIPAHEDIDSNPVTTADFQANAEPTGSEYWKKCTQATLGAYDCPLSADETLVEDCTCPDDFAEAVTAMSVIDKAGKDMICSSGVKQ